MTSETRPRLVGDVMVREVATISPMASLREALREMRQRRVKSLVVGKAHPHDAYGILTYTSILRTIVAEEGDIDLANVYDVMSKPAISVPEGMEIKYAARLMVSQSIRRVIVLRSDELAGIVTMSDIVESIMALADT
ncbi:MULTISPECIES: CBS domain-containing protein [unclassified Guyparkeria]|uniref:CBS domain-containing protein n=1 Tax=unclassified Guyparkeria TaxID=2626246 RepID=UPI00073399F7|nr:MULTISPECIES: CBS domain-containing protein [unclassified Guyparkeria]KTG17242.1 histidine kinase [Guyparkeria sp. XI15]OAE87219.1 histidine kinase [Guyparkeria sp. WRN-7]